MDLLNLYVIIYITICSYVYIRNKVNHFTICIDKAVTVDCTKALSPAELRAISVAASIEQLGGYPLKWNNAVWVHSIFWGVVRQSSDFIKAKFLKETCPLKTQ